MRATTTDVTTELLLEHAGFLRSLARRLVSDENLADDIEQETWLAAIEHPPRNTSSPRGWLATAAKNLLRDDRRRRERRTRREQSLAKPERVDSSFDAMARLDTARDLIEAVEALSKPNRDVIVMRFYEGLPPRDIAKRLGVSREAVKGRLKRSLAMLRERLDERHGDRTTWCLGLVSFLSDPRPESVAPMSGGIGAALLTGGLIMTKAKLAAITVGIVGAFLGGWMIVQSMTGSPEMGEPRTISEITIHPVESHPSTKADLLPARAPSIGDHHPEGSNRLRAAITPPSLRVVARDPTGTPAHGCHIEVDWDPGGVSTMSEITDEDGIVEFGSLPLGELELSILQEGWFAIDAPQFVEIQNLDDSRTIEVVVNRTASVQGVVETAVGDPIPNAQIRVKVEYYHDGIDYSRGSGGGQTDSEGKFLAANLAAFDGATCDVVANHREYLDRHGITVSLRSGQTADVGILTLRNKGGAAEGRLVRADGKPVSGYHLRLFSDESVEESEPIQRSRSGVDGGFRFQGLTTGDYVVRVVELNRDEADAVFAISLPGEELELADIVLPDSRYSLPGRVVDGNGDPVEGASVELRPQEVETDAEGSFLFEREVPGPASLTVTWYPPGEPCDQMRTEIDDVRLDGHFLEVPLIPTGGVFVFYDDDTDELIRWEYAEVSSSGPNNEGSTWGQAGPATRFRINWLREGRWQFRIHVAGYRPVRFEDVLPTGLDRSEYRIPVRLKKL